MGRWQPTPDKFLTSDERARLDKYITGRRDLAIARGNDKQAVRDYYMVKAFLGTGLRLFELCDLINSDHDKQRLIVRSGKGGKPGVVILTKAVANMLKEWKEIKTTLGYSTAPEVPMFPSRYGRKYGRRAVQDRVSKIFKAVGIKHSTHHFRHTYISALIETGKVGLATVRDNARHSSIQTTNLYSHGASTLEGIEIYK